jgi:hypothetical protein
MLTKVCFFLLPNFGDDGKFLPQLYASLIIRFNGEGTLISSENSFLALYYSVEQDRGRGLRMESKFHCQKTKAGEEIPFCVLEKMRITISNLDICKKNNLKGFRKDSSRKNVVSFTYSRLR